MKRLTITSLVLVLMAAITVGAIGVLVVSAQEKKEVYVPTADMKTLVDNKPLHGVDGKHVTIVHGSFPAGWLGGRHYHTGQVYVYVLEGSFTIDEQGKPRQTFTVGQLYEEPIGTPMQARNINMSEQLKVLLFQVHGARCTAKVNPWRTRWIEAQLGPRPQWLTPEDDVWRRREQRRFGSHKGSRPPEAHAAGFRGSPGSCGTSSPGDAE